MDYFNGKNKFNFGVDPTQNGRMAAIFDFCCATHRCQLVNIDENKYLHVAGCDGGMHSTDGFLVERWHGRRQ